MWSQVSWPHALVGPAQFAAGAGLLVLLSVGLVFGPQIDDAAWDHDAHVTPEQAMLHWALEAQGLVQHHHVEPSGSRPAAPASQGDSALLSPGNSSLSFGTRASTASAGIDLPCAVFAPCGMIWTTEHLSDLFRPVPDAPPPRDP